MTESFVCTPMERASRRLGLFLLLVIGVLLTVALFYVKTGAKEAKADVMRLERQIEAERAAIAVLEAERAVLTNPARLRELSHDRLDLEVIEIAATQQSVGASE